MFPSIDKQQALRQLKLLGHNSNENIYLRFFYPSHDPRKDEDKGRKSDNLNWHEIEAYQRQGRGAYFVINGGGHKNEDVQTGRALFLEHDNLDKEIQLELWKTLELPEPTFQVDTGGKSIHSYWVLSAPIVIAQWCELQRDLLDFADGDRSIKNPARVMRLAGAWHISIDESGKPVYNLSQIVAQSGQKYSYEQLKAAISICQQEDQLPLLKQTAATVSRNSPKLYFSTESELPRHPDQISVPVAVAVPLACCLAKESRFLLERGIPQGERNTGGAKLARDLIGTESYLRSICQSVDGNSRHLLEDYASRCTPPLPAAEVESIWKSALASQPTPSCKNEGVEACIRGWYWREHLKPFLEASDRNSKNGNDNGYRSGRGFGSPDRSHADEPNPRPTLNNLSLLERIREILESYEKDSERVSALMDLAAEFGRPYRDLDQLVHIIQKEGDLAEEVIEALNGLKTNLKSYRKRLNVSSFLHQDLARLLTEAAEAMPTAVEYLFTPLLSASASRIGTAARAAINPSGGYFQSLNFWTANVSHSGQAKTPPQQVIIKPLQDLEAEEAEVYEREQKEYEQNNGTELPPPKRKRFLLNNVTTPVKIRIHHENPRGLLEYIDELVADFTRMNQYKAGKGDDLQLELSFFNGDSTSYDRSDARLFLPRTALSKTGTYQWETLARLMSDEVNFISTGYAARFLFCSILDAPVRYLNLFNSSDAVERLQKKLRWLYEELSKLPEADYLLSHEAKVLFQAWNHTLVDAEMAEPHYGVSLVYSKIESYTSRIALWLHLNNAILRGEKPAPVISSETMKHAIEIASFYLWQHKLIHAHNCPTRQLEGVFLKTQTQAEKAFSLTGQGIGASWLKTRINALKKWTVEKIRTVIWKALELGGYGRVEGEGTQMVYLPNTVSPPVSPAPTNGSDSVGAIGGIGGQLVVPPIAETNAHNGIEKPIGEIGEGNEPECIQSECGHGGLPHEQLARGAFLRLPQKSLLLAVAHKPLTVGGNFPSTNSSSNGQPELGGENLRANTHFEEESPGFASQDLSLHFTNFTNSSPSTLDQDNDLAIGASHQLDHQPPIEQSQATDEDEPPSSGGTLLPSEPNPTPGDSDGGIAVESFTEPNEEVDTCENEETETPTLGELQSLLLACQTLAQQKGLKLKYKRQVHEAYRRLSFGQQIQVDRVSALAVPHEVFKYTGQPLERDGQKLATGALVFIDPNAKVNKTVGYVSVWLLRSLEFGWQKALSVSQNCLVPVEKAISADTELVESQQFSFLD